MRSRIASGLVVIAAALGVAACGTSSNATQPTTSERATPPRTPDRLGEVGTLEQLKDAAVAAGYVCANWSQSDHVTKAAESGSCSDADVFSTYLSSADRDAIVDGLKAFGDSTLLVGPNWIINSASAPELQASLGGTVVRGQGTD